jgi:hypothetical protein
MDNRLGSLLYFLPLGQKLTVLADEGVPAHLHLPFAPENGIKVIQKRHGTLKEVQPADACGIVFFLTSSRLPDSVLKRRIKQCGLDPISSYLIVPGFSNPRWFLPNNRTLIKKSGNIIKPSSIKARIAWGLTKLMNSIGLPQVIFPGRLITASANSVKFFSKGVLTDFLSRQLNKKSIEFILYTGHSYYQKCTAQVMDADGTIIAYAKIGSSEQASKRIEGEGKVLKELSTFSFKRLNFPGLIGVDKLEGAPATVLVQSPPPEGYTIVKRRLEERHIDALVELFHVKKRTIIGDELISGMTSIVRRFSSEGENHHSILDEIGKATYELTPCLSGKKIILGASHGDFTPWNIYFKGQNIFVFDWELFSLRLPLWDVYNFILHTEIFIFHRDSKELLKILSDTNGRYVALIDRYENTMKTSQSLDRRLLLSWYLIEILIFYIDISIKQESSGFEKDIAGEKIINIASAMLKMITAETGNV